MTPANQTAGISENKESRLNAAMASIASIAPAELWNGTVETTTSIPEDANSTIIFPDFESLTFEEPTEDAVAVLSLFFTKYYKTTFLHFPVPSVRSAGKIRRKRNRVQRLDDRRWKRHHRVQACNFNLWVKFRSFDSRILFHFDIWRNL